MSSIVVFALGICAIVLVAVIVTGINTLLDQKRARRKLEEDFEMLRQKMAELEEKRKRAL